MLFFTWCLFAADAILGPVRWNHGEKTHDAFYALPPQEAVMLAANKNDANTYKDRLYQTSVSYFPQGTRTTADEKFIIYGAELSADKSGWVLLHALKDKQKDIRKTYLAGTGAFNDWNDILSLNEKLMAFTRLWDDPKIRPQPKVQSAIKPAANDREEQLYKIHSHRVAMRGLDAEIEKLWSQISLNLPSLNKEIFEKIKKSPTKNQIEGNYKTEMHDILGTLSNQEIDEIVIQIYQHMKRKEGLSNVERYTETHQNTINAELVKKYTNPTAIGWGDYYANYELPLGEFVDTINKNIADLNVNVLGASGEKYDYSGNNCMFAAMRLSCDTYGYNFLLEILIPIVKWMRKHNISIPEIDGDHKSLRKLLCEILNHPKTPLEFLNERPLAEKEVEANIETFVTFTIENLPACRESYVAGGQIHSLFAYLFSYILAEMKGENAVRIEVYKQSADHCGACTMTGYNYTDQQGLGKKVLPILHTGKITAAAALAAQQTGGGYGHFQGFTDKMCTVKAPSAQTL